MTKRFHFALMSCALLLGGALASCSNEGPADDSKVAEGNMLVRSPKMIAYTNGMTFGDYGTKAEDLENAGGETEVIENYVSKNDVEINLSLNEEVENGTTEEGEEFSKDYISSHLSLHVRTPQNVKITLPVPSTYVCDADDMAIVKKHLEDHFVYGDQNHTLSMNIAGQNVTVTVAYTAENFTITTSGINETVINALAEDYKDGITFEIWNYYNTELTRAQLKEMLNNATVEFLEEEDNVDYYVNAFNELRKADEETGEEISRTLNPWDCTVSIVSGQAENFTAITPGSEEYLDGFHGYNGSNLNKVFRNKRLDPKDDDQGTVTDPEDEGTVTDPETQEED